jgi:hypothetical protein
MGAGNGDEEGMIFPALTGLSLLVLAATGPIHAPDPTDAGLTSREKTATISTLVERATECIAARVAGDARYAAQEAAGTLGDLIVESVPPCLEPVRAMIDAHDRFYGEGSGEAFFMGPYLDVLPRAVALRRQSEIHPDGATASTPAASP